MLAQLGLLSDQKKEEKRRREKKEEEEEEKEEEENIFGAVIHSRHFTYIIPFNLHNPVRQVLRSSFFAERLKNSHT